jgi:hypothetical protein
MFFSNGTQGYIDYYYSTDKNPFAELKAPIRYYLHNGGLQQPNWLPIDLVFHLSRHRVVEYDDYNSGNFNIPMKIAGGADSGYVRVIDNNFVMSTITLQCP